MTFPNRGKDERKRMKWKNRKKRGLGVDDRDTEKGDTGMEKGGGED